MQILSNGEVGIIGTVLKGVFTEQKYEFLYLHDPSSEKTRRLAG